MIIMTCFRSFLEHRQPEEYNSFTRRAAKIVAAVCILKTSITYTLLKFYI